MLPRPVPPDAQSSAPRLYSLDQEIGEKTNLAEDNPEIVAKLTEIADVMNKEIGGDHPSARRPAGRVANPTLLYPAEPRAKATKERPAKPQGKSE